VLKPFFGVNIVSPNRPLSHSIWVLLGVSLWLESNRSMIRTQLTANQCYVFSTDSIFTIPLIFTFIIAKVIMFRYLNIFIILVIAYHREIVHVIESPSKLDGLTHCIKRFYKCPFFPWLSHRKKFYLSSEEVLSDDEFKCELTWVYILTNVCSYKNPWNCWVKWPKVIRMWFTLHCALSPTTKYPTLRESYELHK